MSHHVDSGPCGVRADYQEDEKCRTEQERSPAPAPEGTDFSVGLLAVLALMLGALPAQASGPGSGDFEGLEYPPAATPTAPGCAIFDPTVDPDGSGPLVAGPLVHELDMMNGDFHTENGTGTATFTGSTTDPYYASPLGTFSDPLCTTPYAVPGTLSITFQGSATTFTCSNQFGEATYQRTANSLYQLTGDVDCDGDSSNGPETPVEFTGTQVPCTPLIPCSDPDAGAFMEGRYEQS